MIHYKDYKIPTGTSVEIDSQRPEYTYPSGQYFSKVSLDAATVLWDCTFFKINS